MKTIQLIIRVITSPIVFWGVAFSLIFFISPLMFIIGIWSLLGKIIGCNINESLKEILFLIFGFIIIPFLCSKSFIIKGEIFN